MRFAFWLALLLAGIALPAVHAASPAAKVGADVHRALDDGSARVLVMLDVAPSRRPVALRATVAAAQARVLQGMPASAYRMRALYSHLPALSLEIGPDALPALLAQQDVAAIQLDGERRLQDAGSDALTRADRVHGTGFTGADTRVAVIDSGIDGSHLALADSLLHEACFRSEGDCPNGSSGPGSALDQGGHGTHVSGIITGADGVAPDAGIIALKVFTTGSTTDSNILAALNAVVANHGEWRTDIVNMSLGGGNFADVATCDAANSAYLRAFQQLNALGIAVFVATGNDARIDAVGAPACVSGAIGVGSVSDAPLSLSFSNCIDNGTPDKVSCFSNATPVQGPGELVDLLAPGCMITAEQFGGGSASTVKCGTSMATPTAAGIAATLLQIDPLLTPAELEDLLERTGVAVTDYRTGVAYPRIDAYAAYASFAIELATPALQATASDSSRVELRWDDVLGEDRYELQRSADGSHWSALAQLAGNVTSYVDAAPPCGPQWYRLRAADSARDAFSAFSTPAASTARACPEAPATLSAARTAEWHVALSWSAGSGGTEYVVERSVDGAPWRFLVAVDAASLGYLDATLECATASYRVRGHNAATGEVSRWTDSVAAEPCPAPAPPPGGFVTLAPADGGRVVAADAPVHFEWSPAADAETYVLSIRSGQQVVLSVASLTAPAHTLTAAQQQALAAGAYRWQVTAHNGSGQTPGSEVSLLVLEALIFRSSF